MEIKIESFDEAFSQLFIFQRKEMKNFFCVAVRTNYGFGLSPTYDAFLFLYRRLKMIFKKLRKSFKIFQKVWA
jgi:hypothetical protein